MSFRPLKANGRYYDHTSLRLSGLPAGLDGSLFTAHVVSINWSEKVTADGQRGVHGIKLPRGRGTYEASASLEIIFEAWDELTKALAREGMDGYSDFDFDLVINLKTRGRASEIILKEASLLAPSVSSAQGQAGITTKVDLYVRYITTNGVCAYPLDLEKDLQAALDQALGIEV